ncbi:MAG: TonB-dependent receptor [Holophagales bacterium]|nr:TonB-dependent receptor [Holophagales bacterium]
MVDSSGNPIAGARVRLTSPSMMAERSGATNSQGVFIARLLPPGNYTIEITAGGFQTARTTRNIGMDQHFQPRIVLQTVAGATVEVIASASSAVDPTSVQTSSNYSADRISSLPTGRGVVAMAQLSPGVTSGVNDIQIRGSNGTGNLYLLDGQNLHDNVYNSLAFPIINDSIEETQVITGAISAEYGNVEGGVINTLTKSGGNEFSGLYRVDLSNSAWNALRRGQPHPANLLNEFKTYVIGGYLLKDRLWFHFSYYDTEQSTDAVIAADSKPGPGARNTAYTQTIGRQTRTFKLTYRINNDHSLIGTYSNGSTDVTNIDYLSGELDTLIPQIERYEMYNVSWRAIWSPTFNTEVRFGAKTMLIAGGATGSLKEAIYDLDTDYFFNAGLFNGDDGGDNRDNQTANLKGSLFLNAHGLHEIDFGIDYYKGKRQAKNMQSPTNRIFYVEEWDVAAKTGYPIGVETYESTDASANQTTYGLYVNDKWKVNNNIAVQIGVRWDQYKADADDFNGTIASASGFSPRLGVTYDLFGDQKWIFKASYCRYNGAVLEAITGAVSGAGNPKMIIYYADFDNYPWGDPQPLSVITDLRNYPDIGEYSNPTLNIAINSSLKAPAVDEMQLSAQYSFVTEKYGRGYVSLTGVKKDWKNLIDYSAGNHGTAYDSFIDEDFYIRYWDNISEAERKYQALELVADYVWGDLHVNGNVTWSELKGNYDSEVDYVPGAAQGINFFNVVDGVKMYDTKDRTPYGYLTGHRPIIINGAADYTHKNSFGRTTYGFIYRFSSGAHYSNTRLNRPQALNRDLPGDFGDTWTQFMNGRRGDGVFNASAYHDFAITHDFNLFKVMDYQVTAFVKLDIRNIFNHMQLVTWNINWQAVPNNSAASLDSPWEPARAYGTTGVSNWGQARTYTISAGIRF